MRQWREALEAHGVVVEEMAAEHATEVHTHAGFDVVCAVGGDGTLLRAASILPDGMPAWLQRRGRRQRGLCED